MPNRSCEIQARQLGFNWAAPGSRACARGKGNEVLEAAGTHVARATSMETCPIKAAYDYDSLIDWIERSIQRDTFEAPYAEGGIMLDAYC